MEVAGLVLGIAGLYAVCTEIVDQFDSFKDFGISSSQLAARFEAEKLRLREWADVAGIQGGVLLEKHHRRLDDLAVRAIAYQILHSIVDLFPRAEQSLHDAHNKLSDNKAPHARFKAKIKWAFGNEARFTRHVEAFELLTSKLYDLVPLDFSTESGDVATVTQPDIQLLFNVHEDLRILLEANKNQAIAEDKRTAYHFLKPPKVSEDFDNSLSKCLPGTCEWIFGLPDFKEWLAPENTRVTRLLWLNGTAGSGKSVLCSRIVSHLRKLPDVHCFHFFCTTHAQAGGRLDDIIRVWLHEITSMNQSCLEVLIRTISLAGTSMSVHIWRVFGELITELGNCVFVIDGLDEFDKSDDQRQTFLEKLKKSLAWTGSRVLITSRDEVDLRRGIEEPQEGISIILHKILQTDTEADVKLFSQEIVKQKLGTKDREFQTELAATLAGRSEGMFLWIALSSKYLRGGLSKARILQTIRNVPDGLLFAYARSWKFILDQPKYEKSRALDILGWCVSSIRPLTIAELTIALITNTDSIDTTDLPDEIDDEYVNGEIIDLCSSLVETRSSSGESLSKQTVHIVHFSVKDFLSSVVEQPVSHLELARRCLGYLCYKNKVPGISNEFYDYAINHWHLHQSLSKSTDDSFDKLVIEFFTLHEDIFLEWTSIFEKNLPSKSDATAVRPSPIYFAASLNLNGPVRSFVNKDLNRKAGKLGAPLHAVCYYGHIEILKLLLDLEVDIENPESVSGTALHVAVGQNHFDMVKLLVKHKASINTRIEDGQTPIWKAAGSGYSDMVEYLVKNHADILLPEIGGWTPLHIASANGHFSVVKILLEAGAEMKPDSKCKTPLHLAASRGHLAIIRLLLDYGATYLTSNEDGWTPLNSACSGQHVEVVEFLLSLSKDNIDKPAKRGFTPVITAASCGNLELVKLLSHNGADLTLGTDIGYNALHFASSAGHFAVVKFLLERDPSLIHLTSLDGCTFLYAAAFNDQPDILTFLSSNWPDKINIPCNTWTPLNAAAGLGHQKCVEILLDHGAEMNTQEQGGQSPLHSAVSIGHLEIVRTLLNHGADTRSTLANGCTPLMTATQEGNLEVVKILVEQGKMDVATQAKDGAVVLHFAALNGYSRIVQYLIDHGADPKASDNVNVTVLHSAVRHGNIEVVKTLLNNGADSCLSSTTDDGNTPLLLASSLGHSHLIELLIVDINVRNGIGMTSLNLAATEGQLDVVKILLSRGADMQPSDEQHTPLNNSAFNGHFEVVKVLLDHGAEVNALNKKHWTPLHAACLGNHVSTIEYLLDHGADVTIPNINGTFPLHSIAKHESTTLVKLFIEKGAKINQLDNNKNTALMIAVLGNKIGIAEILLSHGASPNIINIVGHSSLLVSLKARRIDLTWILLKHGADTTIIDEQDRTILHWAARTGDIDILRWIFERIDHNRISDQPADQRCDKEGKTALHFAVASGNVDCAEYIHNKGHDIDALDTRGKSILDYACASASANMVAWVSERYKSNQTSWSYLHWACRAGDFQLVKLLYDLGYRAKAVKDEDLKVSWSPFDIARYYRNDRIVSASGEISSDPWDQIKDNHMIDASELKPVFSNSLIAQDSNFGRICDGCFANLSGSVFHCLDCLDFDYCMMCKHDAHISHPGHKWKMIEPS